MQPADIPTALKHRLQRIEDPEMGLSILDLGLIYGFEEKDNAVRLTMTLTSPTCPMGGLITDQVEEALAACFPGKPTEVVVTFDPPWTPERMTDDAF
ncbi:MAG: metal-sulfur cluster assembly factor [Gammaproteobacteria bacterium]|nr:MAG: metal-sulfur cluster assembly factor [Gammaproteobacteria bacterium]